MGGRLKTHVQELQFHAAVEVRLEKWRSRQGKVKILRLQGMKGSIKNKANFEGIDIFSGRDWSWYRSRRHDAGEGISIYCGLGTRESGTMTFSLMEIMGKCRQKGLEKGTRDTHASLVDQVLAFFDTALNLSYSLSFNQSIYSIRHSILLIFYFMHPSLSLLSLLLSLHPPIPLVQRYNTRTEQHSLCCCRREQG